MYAIRLLSAIVAITTLFASHPVRERPTTQRLRLIVLTDISSLTPGVREPDDGQSMIRLMLYSNDLDIEGLIATSNMIHGQVTRPELIREVVHAFSKIRPNLLLHSKEYPTESYLLDRIKSGWPTAGPRLAVEESVGERKDTEGSNWIIRVVDRPDPRPVWVTIWGGSADLAQALWKVRRTRAPDKVVRFCEKLRVIAINDQDSTGPWIRTEFPDVWYEKRTFSYRGMYRGGDTSLVSSAWVEEHIHGHGALGDLYPNYNGGDIWSNRLGPVRGIKEGDTPSFLSLIPNGLNDPNHPEWGGWGGRCVPDAGNPRHFVDTIDPLSNSDRDPAPQMSTVYRWRAAFQADLQARLDWCVKGYQDANHPPAARIKGGMNRTVMSGSRIDLDARRSRDPDGNKLTYQWRQFKEAGTYRGDVVVRDADTRTVNLLAPIVSKPETVQLILTVTDNGNPPLRSYQRVIVTILPKP